MTEMSDSAATTELLTQAIEQLLDQREQRIDEEVDQVRERYFWALERGKSATQGISSRGDRRNRQMEPKITRSARSRVASVAWRQVMFRGKGVLPGSRHFSKGVKPMYSLKKLRAACNSWEWEPVLQAETLFAQIRAEAASIAAMRQQLRKLQAELSRQATVVEQESDSTGATKFGPR